MLRHVALVIIITFTLLSIQTSHCDQDNVTQHSNSAGNKKTTVKENKKLSIAETNNNDNITTINHQKLKPEILDVHKLKINDTKVKNVPTTQNNNSVTSTEPPHHHTAPTLDPGALKRAIYVFAGLSVLVMGYLLFRSTRLRKSPAQMVRKYGVLTNKQDLEMRPLPLDEDDDDETTVFDASGLSVHSQSTKA